MMSCIEGNLNKAVKSADSLALIEKFRKLNLCLQKEIIPEPEARMNVKKKWMCRYCEHSKDCYKETPGELLG